MRTMFSIGVAVLCGIVAGASLAQAGEFNQAWANQSLTSMPLTFTQNMGQWDEQVLFRADAGGTTMWITGEGVVYQFVRAVDDPDADADASVEDAVGPAFADTDFESLVVKTSFVGANIAPLATGKDKMGYKCNYFHGSDPAKWRSNVPNFEAIVLDEVYPGIDLTYYGNGQRMEYDFVVSPGADHSRIQIKYEGAESIAVAADGSLSVTTAWGEIKELTPVVYQSVNGERRAITAEYAVGDDNTFGFNLGKDYDRTLPVTIDPELEYSTYLGGTFTYDEAWDIAVDGAGHAFVTGWTSYDDFPSVDPYQTYQGYFDVVVSKFSADGDSLLYSTYLGGDFYDEGRGIVLGPSGTIYVAGMTCSENFPTAYAYETELEGDSAYNDAFLVKLTSEGDSLIFGTYIGGVQEDSCLALAVDESGAAYITGRTESTDFPTLNQYQTNQTGSDAFVAKFTGSGTLGYSTYLGGSGDDASYAIAVDGSGAAYLTGNTSSNNFPTLNQYQSTGSIFATKLDGDCSADYSTYLPGSNAFGIDVDTAGAAYIARSGGVTKVAPTGSSLVYSASVSGSLNDIAIDPTGSAHVTGNSNDAYTNALVARLSMNGQFQLYYTTVGGSFFDFGYGIALGEDGADYVAGRTYSSDFELLNAYDSTFGGGRDGFVSKFEAASCCLDRVGDADQSGDDEPTIGDVSSMIDAKFISGYCPGILDCLLEADINQSGEGDPTCDDITIGDISILNTYLFGDPKPTLPDCYW